ncbi:carbohydrate kinase family protein [Paenibacillus allorhizosphaerae]|uniref:Pseudouridine kinase n=1 Tax=Paenibacillus allorhizosphaerae TaxID=2849866 RepID=A0ABN7TE41_9BACL|nr:PfkB family carbohydrate kinase [Paenibacillus allorhizosphaerae]CAG7627156.1 Pseudouridine kinase [Paenibacillus allorhizosphaerae]
MTTLVTVIGTIFVDCKGFAHQSYNPLGRNLGSIQFVHGGVGRNVVENLANLSIPSAFVSTLDESALGEEIKKRLEDANVSIDHVLHTPSEGMGMWLAVLNENGDLVGSISQMPNLLTLQDHVLKRGEEIVKKSSHLALELDLTEPISRHFLELAKQWNKPVYGIPGNLDIILKHSDLLDMLDCFICNNIEAEKLVGDNFNTLDIQGKIAALTGYVDSIGLKSMVVTLGEEGSIYYDSKTKQSGYQPAFPVQLVDTSGAGDAFFSGTVTGLVRGLPLGEAVVCGTKVAAWTIESKENNCRELGEKTRSDEVFQTLLVK